MASTTADVRKMYPPPSAQARDAGRGMQPAPGSEAGMALAPDFGEKSYVGANRLAGKAALITGADSGIGRAVALAFAREGADVAVAWSGSAAEDKDARHTVELVEGEGRKAALLAADLRTHDACVQIVELARAAGLGDGPRGTLDILVLNHAFQPVAAPQGAALDKPRTEWDDVMAVNVGAFHSLMQATVPHMRAERGPAIIATTSVEAYQPNAAIGSYAVSKAAIKGLIQAYAPELVQAKGIRLNGVAPGPIWTPLIPQSFPGEPEKKKTDESFSHDIKSHGASYPVGRAGQPAECAGAFVFLADTKASSYVAGEVLAVTGGKPTA
jgi:NAD(P)-dependent dehydrogenase (short-subunit alcohol dehydrogenase family)